MVGMSHKQHEVCPVALGLVWEYRGALLLWWCLVWCSSWYMYPNPMEGNGFPWTSTVILSAFNCAVKYIDKRQFRASVCDRETHEARAVLPWRSLPSPNILQHFLKLLVAVQYFLEGRRFRLSKYVNTFLLQSSAK